MRSSITATRIITRTRIITGTGLACLLTLLLACAQAPTGVAEVSAETPAASEAAAPAASAPAAAASAPAAAASAPAAAASAPAAGAEGYAHSVTAAEVTMQWAVNGEQLDIQLSAPTAGWVAVGFNPEPGSMKGANIIIGTVKGDEVIVQDHFGTLKTNHKADDKIGGSNHVSNAAGTEADGTTTISFSIPLDSGDANDGAIDAAGNTVVMLAYGKSDVLSLKHRGHALVEVNLSTGEHKVLEIKE